MRAGSPRPPTEASTTLSAQRGLGRPLSGGRARQGPWGDSQADALWAVAAASLAAVSRGWGKEQELPPPGYWAAEPTARPSQCPQLTGLSVPGVSGATCPRLGLQGPYVKAGLPRMQETGTASATPVEASVPQRRSEIRGKVPTRQPSPNLARLLARGPPSQRPRAFPGRVWDYGESWEGPGTRSIPRESAPPHTPSGNGATGAPGMRGAAHRDSGAQAPGPRSEARPLWAGFALAVPGSNGGSTQSAGAQTQK